MRWSIVQTSGDEAERYTKSRGRARVLLARTIMRSSPVVPFAVAALALVACGRSAEERPARAAVTAAQLEGSRRLMNDDAAMVVARARCEREAACIEGKPAPDPLCLEERLRHQATTLAEESCPAGVDERQLTACVDAVERLSCDEAASAPAACQANVLCASPARP